MKDRLPEPVGGEDSCAQFSISGGKAEVSWNSRLYQA
jgi:hypothetical protein